jgi:hypothetical protein
MKKYLNVASCFLLFFGSICYLYSSTNTLTLSWTSVENDWNYNDGYGGGHYYDEGVNPANGLEVIDRAESDTTTTEIKTVEPSQLLDNTSLNTVSYWFIGDEGGCASSGSTTINQTTAFVGVAQQPYVVPCLINCPSGDNVGMLIAGEELYTVTDFVLAYSGNYHYHQTTTMTGTGASPPATVDYTIAQNEQQPLWGCRGVDQSVVNIYNSTTSPDGSRVDWNYQKNNDTFSSDLCLTFNYDGSDTPNDNPTCNVGWFFHPGPVIWSTPGNSISPDWQIGASLYYSGMSGSPPSQVIQPLERVGFGYTPPH